MHKVKAGKKPVSMASGARSDPMDGTKKPRPLERAAGLPGAGLSSRTTAGGKAGPRRAGSKVPPGRGTGTRKPASGTAAPERAKRPGKTSGGKDGRGVPASPRRPPAQGGKAPARTSAARARKPRPADRAAAGGRPAKAAPSGAPAKRPPDRLPVLGTAFGRALKEDISTVLVTGAASTVGFFLIQHLLREGLEVVATDRKIPNNQYASERKGLTLKPGDLGKPSFASSCLQGVDAVFHLPVYTEPGTSRPDSAAFGGHGTRNLVAAARRLGVKRLIHIGSALVYQRLAGPIRESTPLEARNEYEHGQIEAERMVFTDAPPGLPVVTVLRSASIYGPLGLDQMASVATLPPLVKALGPYYLRLSGGPRINLVHGEDVARAAVFLLFHPVARGQVYNLGDLDPMPFGNFVNHAMEAYGLKPLGPGIPYPPSTFLQSILPHVAQEEIFNPLTHLSSLLWDRMARKRRLVKALSPRIDQVTLSLGTRDFVLDSRKLMALGFTLKYPSFKKGWARTLEWYVANRWIPRPEEL